MRNTNVFHYVQHSCWDPVPSEQKGQLCILTQIYHIILFSPTLPNMAPLQELFKTAAQELH